MTVNWDVVIFINKLFAPYLVFELLLVALSFLTVGKNPFKNLQSNTIVIILFG